MSGGYWNYKDRELSWELFGWRLNAHYGQEGYSQAKEARKLNPLEDREVSEMLWDMLCLLNSYDYYHSGDTNENQYREDLKYFKDKWLGRTNEDRLNAMKDDLKDYCDELIKEMGDNYD